MWGRKNEPLKTKLIEKSEEDKDTLYEPSVSSYISDQRRDGTVEDAVNRLYRPPPPPSAGIVRYLSLFFSCFIRRSTPEDFFELAQNESQAEVPDDWEGISNGKN